MNRSFVSSLALLLPTALIAAITLAASGHKPQGNAPGASAEMPASWARLSEQDRGESFGGSNPPNGPALGGGACCFPDDCADVASESECASLGGVYLEGESCADGACGVGACCTDPAGCVEIDAYSCITGGREFAGAGTFCIDDPCEFGVGACCFGEECQTISEDDCIAQGGVWLGPGENCTLEPCVLGACCVGEECFHVARYECDDLGGEFLPGLDCIDNPCVEPSDCPDDTIFSQSKDGPDDFLAMTSEASRGLRRFDRFSEVAGAIERITWWGLDLEYVGGSFIECVESDPTFEIIFHEDAGGFIGDPVCSYTLTATRTPLGISYLGAELNEYEVTLPEPCVLVRGWISIVGLGDPDCWFLWMSAGMGESYCEGCIAPIEDWDVSVCLRGVEGGVFGACCDDDLGDCAEDVEITDCTAENQRFVPDGTCDDLDPPCGVLTGACCLPDASCEILLEEECAAIDGNWLGAFTLCRWCPCITPCVEGGEPEGEVICEDGYVDDFNGGCFSEPPVWSRIHFGDVICGTSGVFALGGDNVPDFDWYEIILDDSETIMTWSVKAEFPARVVIVDGTGGCDGEVLAAVDGFECDELSLTVTVGPGTYWLIVFPRAFSDSAACGARYVASLTRPAPPCLADINDDAMVNVLDLLSLLGAWGPCPPPCPQDLNDDGQVNVLDLLLLLDMWGPCPV
jgi:hypothetical protein